MFRLQNQTWRRPFQRWLQPPTKLLGPKPRLKWKPTRPSSKPWSNGGKHGCLPTGEHGAVPEPLGGSRSISNPGAGPGTAHGHEWGPAGTGSPGLAMRQAVFLGPRREQRSLCSVYTPFHCKQTASVSGEVRRGCLPRGPFSLCPAEAVPHPFPRAGSWEGSLCCAWQVSHCSSAGLSPEQLQQGSAISSSLVSLTFGPSGQV